MNHASIPLFKAGCPSRRGLSLLASGVHFGRTVRVTLLVAAAGGVVSPSVLASPLWSGRANNNDWFTAGNWSPQAVPTAADSPGITQLTPVIGSSGAVGLIVGVGSALATPPLLTIRDSGTLTVGQNLTIGTANSGTVSNGAVSVLNGGTVTAPEVDIGLNTKNAGTLLVDGTGSQLTVTNTGDNGDYGLFASDYGGTSTVTVSNGGLITLAEHPFFARQTGATSTLNLAGGGTMTINGDGYLSLGSYAGYGGTSTVNIGTGGAPGFLNATAINAYVSSGSQATINFNHNAASYRFSVPITGAATINQIGSGQTVFTSNSNTYSGGTNITSGTLLVNNTSGSGTGSGAVTVTGTGSVLGGTGFINAGSNAVSIGSGSILVAGDGTATGVKTTITGALTLANGSAIEIVLGAGGLHSTLARAGGTWTFDPNEKFTLINAQAGTYEDIITGLAADPGTEPGWTTTSAGFTSSFTYDGVGNIDLTIAAVPEPATWLGGSLLGASALVGMLVRRRGAQQ